MTAESPALEVTVRDAAGRPHACRWYPRQGYGCGACARGWIHERVGAACPECGAVVAAVERAPQEPAP